LAKALHNDKLFAFDALNRGLTNLSDGEGVALAYAQSDWVQQFIVERWGQQALVDMLEMYADGMLDEPVLEVVTGLPVDSFMSDFQQWAKKQTDRWGLTRQPLTERAEQVVQQRGKGVEDEELLRLIEENDQHPSLVRIMAERKAEGFDVREAYRWVNKYAAMRPIDPWPHRALAKIALDLGKPQEAVGSLQILEREDRYTAAWATQLAGLHAEAGQLKQASNAIQRAIYCEPYNAELREQAARYAVMNKDLETAAYQVEALAMLEPDRAQHPKRLAVIYERLGRLEEAAEQKAKVEALNAQGL
jgi:tetratricopeptide (TPR) repeat protein